MSDLTPNPKQLQYWIDKISYPHSEGVGPSSLDEELACLAYRAGADYELEKCCEWLEKNCGRWEIVMSLRTARRPKPPSETDQALETLNFIESESSYDKPMFDTIRRALERLKELEEIK
jgi:hypothetical protein